MTEAQPKKQKAPLINLITAVARPHNLPPMWHAIQATMVDAIRVRWILIFDQDRPAPAYITSLLKQVGVRIPLTKIIFKGPYYQWGILQRNLGLQAVEEGWFFPHDDDSIVHPDFFRRMGELITEHPDKKAIAFNQIRWDGRGNEMGPHRSKILTSTPNTMRISRVDSAMVLLHRDLAGEDLYDPAKGMGNDGDFIERMYHKDPHAWLFVNEVLAYYNYLRIDHKGVASQHYRKEVYRCDKESPQS